MSSPHPTPLPMCVCVCVWLYTHRTLNLIEFPLDWEHRDNTSNPPPPSRIGNLLPFLFQCHLKTTKYVRVDMERDELDHVVVVVRLSHFKARRRRFDPFIINLKTWEDCWKVDFDVRGSFVCVCAVLCIYISIELPNALSVLLLLLCVFFSLSLAYAHGTAQHITPSPPTAAAAAILQQDVLLPIICRHVLAKPKLLCISYTVTRKSIRRLLLLHQQLILHSFIKLKRKKDTAKKKKN